MRTHPAWIGLVTLELGLAATLASGFCERSLSIPGHSAIGYGWPVVWHGRAWLVYSIEPTVSWISLEALLLDTAFWTLVFAICVLVWVKRPRRGPLLNTSPSAHSDPLPSTRRTCAQALCCANRGQSILTERRGPRVWRLNPSKEA